ncbi:MAG TPA: ParA family protein [Burkholderiales bacterium]|nr:ParA family protein [Burkholderiales bacterium]
MRANTTLVINPKGGSGKSTVAINLASYFAANGVATAVMDYDTQGSSLNWLRIRPAHAPRIHGANAAPQKTGLRTLGMHVPVATEQLIIDAPAGASGLVLQEMLSRAHGILIPVAPSAIDIHATANFIRDLLMTGKVRSNSIRVGVVANRVRQANPVYEPLERFLKSLNLPLLARLGDSDVFLAAAESGLGIFEMDFAVSGAERAQFHPIAEWVERQPLATAAHPAALVSAVMRSGLRVVSSIASHPGYR